MAKFVDKGYTQYTEYDNGSAQPSTPYVPPEYSKYTSYGYWKSTPMPDRPFIDYNDPTELNSMADVILGTFNQSFVRDFKWGGLSKIPILNIIPGAVEVLYDTTIRPIQEKDWTALALNNLMSFTENVDILANPVKAAVQGKGWAGVQDALGFGPNGRSNNDWNTGNIGTDIFLELISDPLNWATLGAKGALTAVIKEGVMSATSKIVRDAGQHLIADTAEEITGAFMKKTVKDAINATATSEVKNFTEGFIASIQHNSSSALASKFTSEEGLVTIKKIEQLLKQQSIDDMSIKLLNSTSALLRPAMNMEKALFKTAIGSTILGMSYYLVYKPFSKARRYLESNWLKTARPFMNQFDFVDITKWTDYSKAVNDRIIPMNQVLAENQDNIQMSVTYQMQYDKAVSMEKVGIWRLLALRQNTKDYADTAELEEMINKYLDIAHPGRNVNLDSYIAMLDEMTENEIAELAPMLAGHVEWLRGVQSVIKTRKSLEDYLNKTLTPQLSSVLNGLPRDLPADRMRYATQVLPIKEYITKLTNIFVAQDRRIVDPIKLREFVDDMRRSVKQAEIENVLPHELAQLKIIRKLANHLHSSLIKPTGTKIDYKNASDYTREIMQRLADIRDNMPLMPEFYVHHNKKAIMQNILDRINVIRQVTGKPETTNSRLLRAVATGRLKDDAWDRVYMLYLDGQLSLSAMDTQLFQHNIMENAAEELQTTIKNIRSNYKEFDETSTSAFIERILDAGKKVEADGTKINPKDYLKTAPAFAKQKSRFSVEEQKSLADIEDSLWGPAGVKSVPDTSIDKITAKYMKMSPEEQALQYEMKREVFMETDWKHLTPEDMDELADVFSVKTTYSYQKEALGEGFEAMAKADVHRISGMEFMALAKADMDDLKLLISNAEDFRLRGVQAIPNNRKLVEKKIRAHYYKVHDPAMATSQPSKKITGLRPERDVYSNPNAGRNDRISILDEIGFDTERWPRNFDIKEFDEFKEYATQFIFGSTHIDVDTMDHAMSLITRYIDLRTVAEGVEDTSDALAHNFLEGLNLNAKQYRLQIDKQQSLEQMLTNTEAMKAMGEILNPGSDIYQLMQELSAINPEYKEISIMMQAYAQSTLNIQNLWLEMMTDPQIKMLIPEGLADMFLNSLQNFAREDPLKFIMGNENTIDTPTELLRKKANQIVMKTEEQYSAEMQQARMKLERYYNLEDIQKALSDYRIGLDKMHTALSDAATVWCVIEKDAGKELVDVINAKTERIISKVYTFDSETTGKEFLLSELVEIGIFNRSGVRIHNSRKAVVSPSERLIETLFSDNANFRKIVADNPMWSKTKCYQEYYKNASTESVTELMTKSFQPMMDDFFDNGIKAKFVGWNSDNFDVKVFKGQIDRDIQNYKASGIDNPEFLFNANRLKQFMNEGCFFVDGLKVEKKVMKVPTITRDQANALRLITRKFLKDQALTFGAFADLPKTFKPELLLLPNKPFLMELQALHNEAEKAFARKINTAGSAEIKNRLSSMQSVIDTLRATWSSIKMANADLNLEWIDANLYNAGLNDNTAMHALNLTQASRTGLDPAGNRYHIPGVKITYRTAWDPDLVYAINRPGMKDTLDFLKNAPVKDKRLPEYSYMLVTIQKTSKIINDIYKSITDYARIREIMAANPKAYPKFRKAVLEKLQSTATQWPYPHLTFLNYETNDIALQYAIMCYFKKYAPKDIKEAIESSMKGFDDSLNMLYHARRLTMDSDTAAFIKKSQDDYLDTMMESEPKGAAEVGSDEWANNKFNALQDKLSFDPEYCDVETLSQTVHAVLSQWDEYLNTFEELNNRMSLNKEARAMLESRAAVLKPMYDLIQEIKSQIGTDNIGKTWPLHENLQKELTRQQLMRIMSMDDEQLKSFITYDARDKMFISITGYEFDTELIAMYDTFKGRLEGLQLQGFHSHIKETAGQSRIVVPTEWYHALDENPEFKDAIGKFVDATEFSTDPKFAGSYLDAARDGLEVLINKLIETPRISKYTQSYLEKLKVTIKAFAGETAYADMMYYLKNEVVYPAPRDPFYKNMHDEIIIVRSKYVPKSKIAQLPTEELDFEDALNKAGFSHPDMEKMANLYKKVWEQQRYLLDSNRGLSLGGVGNRALHAELYDNLPWNLSRVMDPRDRVLDPAIMHQNSLNSSIFGAPEYLRTYFRGSPRELFQTMFNTIKYQSLGLSAVTEYMQLFFHPMESINTGFLAEMGSEVMAKALLAEPSMRLVALVEDAKATNKCRVVEIPVRNAKDIDAVKHLNPRIMHYQTYSKAFQTINDFKFTETWLAMVQKFVYIQKMGYLMSAGAVLRNAVDALVKNAVMTKDASGMMVYYGKAMKHEMQYQTAIQAIINHSSGGRISKRSIDWYFAEDNPIRNKRSHMTAEEFNILHLFKQDGPSAGQAKELDKFYRDASEYKTEELKKILKEMKAKDVSKYDINSRNNHGASIEYYQNLLAAKDTTIAHELWQTSNAFVETTMAPFKYVESIARYAEFLWAYERKGVSSAAANELVVKTHFEYGIKSQFEYAAELLIPFYSFTMRNLEFWANAMERNPRLAGYFSDVMEPIMQFDTIDPYELENNRSLQYQILQGNIGLDPEGWSLKLNPSFMDAYNLLANPIDAWGNRFNAGLKFPMTVMLEAALQREQTQSLYTAASAYVPIVGAFAQRFGETGAKYQDRLMTPEGLATTRWLPSVFGATQRWQPRAPKKKFTKRVSNSATVAYSRGKTYRGHPAYTHKYYPERNPGRYESFYKKHYSDKGNSKFKMRLGRVSAKMLQFRIKDMFYYFR